MEITEHIPYRTGFATDALPKVGKPCLVEDSKTGVSTRYARHKTEPNIHRHWFALRATYSREQKAYHYIKSKGTEAFLPTINIETTINGKRRTITESRIPNMLFAYGTEDEIKSYVYNNTELPYLRFYYKYFRTNNKVVKVPLVIPDYQMQSFKIICNSGADDIMLSQNCIEKFMAGQTVRIIEGVFKGVEGKVARYHGQQRVAVIIDGLFTIATAYIPSAFLEKVQ